VVHDPHHSHEDAQRAGAAAQSRRSPEDLGHHRFERALDSQMSASGGRPIDHGRNGFGGQIFGANEQVR